MLDDVFNGHESGDRWYEICPFLCRIEVSVYNERPAEPQCNEFEVSRYKFHLIFEGHEMAILLCENIPVDCCEILGEPDGFPGIGRDQVCKAVKRVKDEVGIDLIS